MKKKHIVFFGFAVLLTAAMFTMGCGETWEDPDPEQTTKDITITIVNDYSFFNWHDADPNYGEDEELTVTINKVVVYDDNAGKELYNKDGSTLSFPVTVTDNTSGGYRFWVSVFYTVQGWDQEEELKYLWFTQSKHDRASPENLTLVFKNGGHGDQAELVKGVF